MHAGGSMKKDRHKSRISLSAVMTCVVVGLVLTVLGSVLFFFIDFYQSSMEQNAAITSEQAVVQVMNTVEDYTEGMAESMRLISVHMGTPKEERDEFFRSFMEIRSDVVAVTTYSKEGQLLDCWSNGLKRKSAILQNLSYMEEQEGKGLCISKPHVETLFEEYYPWVVTICQNMRDASGQELQVFMDIRFSNIASYVDDVGIGQHGYCYIQDTEGNLIYHPQQQLIYSGLKEEMTRELKSLPDGSHTRTNVIYTIHTLENCNWRVVGVSYVDEMITGRVEGMIRICVALLLLVLLTAVLVGTLFSWIFLKPAKRLTGAMEAFEKEAENFQFAAVRGTGEISALSDSFGHMVVRIQELMEKIAQEEKEKRLSEIAFLQAQINPHFISNVLNNAAWMAKIRHAENLVLLLNSLNALLQSAMHAEEDLIRLSDELNYVDNYLTIMEYSGSYDFSVEKRADEDTKELYIPRFILQPIVENAIYHGLPEDLSRQGEIRISARRVSECLEIAVEDNGMGITEQEIEQVMKGRAKGRGSFNGIGVLNVNERIRLFFGQEYGLHYESEPGHYTRCVFRLPVVEKV